MRFLLLATLLFNITKAADPPSNIHYGLRQRMTPVQISTGGGNAGTVKGIMNTRGGTGRKRRKLNVSMINELKRVLL